MKCNAWNGTAAQLGSARAGRYGHAAAAAARVFAAAASSSGAGGGAAMGPIQASMEAKLRDGLSPVSLLEVRNDSASLRGAAFRHPIAEDVRYKDAQVHVSRG